MKKNDCPPLKLRFSVGNDNGPQSNVWRAWSSRSEVYLSVRSMTKIKKFSFHSSGICRIAFTKEHGTPANMSDRVIVKWRKAETPPQGSRRGACVAKIAVPTDFLSVPTKRVEKTVKWIPPAPAHGATLLDLIFMNETKETILNTFAKAGERNLVDLAALPNGEIFAIISSHIQWENRDLKIPGEGKVNDLLFSADDPDRTGRPIRIVFHPSPKDGDAIMIQELGGYVVT